MDCCGAAASPDHSRRFRGALHAGTRPNLCSTRRPPRPARPARCRRCHSTSSSSTRRSRGSWHRRRSTSSSSWHRRRRWRRRRAGRRHTCRRRPTRGAPSTPTRRRRARRRRTPRTRRRRHPPHEPDGGRALRRRSSTWVWVAGCCACSRVAPAAVGEMSLALVESTARKTLRFGDSVSFKKSKLVCDVRLLRSGDSLAV